MLRNDQNDLLTQTGAGDADGRDVSPLLDPCPARRGTGGERLPAGADQAAVGTADRVPRHRRTLRADRRVLRPSRRLPVVRPQRGARAALPLSRLEIRRDRPVPGCAVRAGGERVLPADQVEILSAGGARRRAVDLYGAARTPAAAAGIRVRDGAAGAQLHLEAAAILQLAAGNGGRHRFKPCLLAAPRRAAQRSADARLARQPVQHGRRDAGVRGGGPPRRPVHRRQAQRRGRRLLLADHPVVHAVVHHDRAARQPSGARPFLDPDRR